MDASFALIIAAAGSAAAWQVGRRRRGRQAQRRIRQSLLKPAARYFYGHLQQAAGDFSIQVAVDARRILVDAESGRRRRGGDAACVDFLLCDSESLEPRLAILLAQGVSEGSGRSGKDEAVRVRRRMEAAGLPCLVFDADAECDGDSLSAAIEEQLGGE